MCEMRDIVVYLMVSLVSLSVCDATTDRYPRHRRRHEWSRKHIIHLQDTVDKLELQQKIDRIHLENLQKTVQNLQNNKNESPLFTSISELKAEEDALSSLQKEAADLRDSVTQNLQSEKHNDEMLQMRQEIAYLRSEVQRVKESRASVSEMTAAHTKAQEQREAVTGAWVVENVRRLQDSVVELQEAFNVTLALHHKQEIDSRLTVVTKDLSAIRSSLAGVTSKAEAASVLSSTVQEELTRTAEDMHRTAGQTGALSTEVSAIRQDFNNLLGALPEGILAAHHHPVATHHSNQDEGSGMGLMDTTVDDNQKATQTKRIADLERRTDQLDFALTHTQQQVSSLVSDSVKDERVARLMETERQLEREVDSASTGIGEVRSSSIQLLAALEALEAKMEKDMAEVKQEVAKLEFSVAESAAVQLNKKQETQETHDDIGALRSDMQALSRRLDQVALKITSLTSHNLEEKANMTRCHTQHLSLNMKLNDTVERLKVLEDRTVQGKFKHRHTRHKFHLPAWSAEPKSTQDRLSPDG